MIITIRLQMTTTRTSVNNESSDGGLSDTTTHTCHTDNVGHNDVVARRCREPRYHDVSWLRRANMMTPCQHTLYPTPRSKRELVELILCAFFLYTFFNYYYLLIVTLCVGNSLSSSLLHQQLAPQWKTTNGPQHGWMMRMVTMIGASSWLAAWDTSWAQVIIIISLFLYSIKKNHR